VAAYRIGVLASGGGSNLQALMDRIRSGDLPAEIAFVLSNNSKSGALSKARAFGAPALHVSAVTEGGDEQAAARITEIVKESRIDLLVLAGYMKLVPAGVLAAMRNRILNIHPALLPAFGGEGFYGHLVHEAVVKRGCQYSGITIHMVDSAYDEGPIVLQRMLRVDPRWSPEQLAAEVLKLEHAWYWRVVKGFATGEIKPAAPDGRGVDAGAFLERLDHEERRG
jgi:phosphoribosylglycinamide formyltransferase 1